MTHLGTGTGARILRLTFKVVVELERGHVPVHRHVPPGGPQREGLLAVGPGLPVLLRAHKTPGQLPVPEFKQVAGVVPDPHWNTEKGEHTGLLYHHVVLFPGQWRSR